MHQSFLDVPRPQSRRMANYELCGEHGGRAVPGMGAERGCVFRLNLAGYAAIAIYGGFSEPCYCAAL